MSEDEQKVAEDARKKEADSKTLSDLKNAKTNLEAYYADHQNYPDTLGTTGFLSSDGVTVSYEPACDTSGCCRYVLITVSRQGTYQFRTSSDSVKIAKHKYGEPFAGWEE